MKTLIPPTLTCALMLLAASATASAQGDAKGLYLSKCATCHGQDGAAKTAKGKKLKVMSAQEATAKMSADEMTKIVTDGKGADMDGYGKQFSQDQIKGMVEYYRSFAK